MILWSLKAPHIYTNPFWLSREVSSNLLLELKFRNNQEWSNKYAELKLKKIELEIR